MARPTITMEVAFGKDWNDVIVPNGVDLDGTGDYASTSDSAALSAVGDVEVRIHWTPDDWTPAANVDMFTKYAGSPELGILFRLRTDGKLQLTWSENGTAWITDAVSSIVLPATTFVNGTTHWVAVTLDVDGGVGGVGRVRFYYFAGVHDAPLALTDWTELGTFDDQGSAPTSINDSTAGVDVGSSVDEVFGQVHEMQYYDGLQADAGTLVANPRFSDASQWAIGDTGTSDDAQGNTWTLQNNAVITGSWIDLSADAREPIRTKGGRQTPFTRTRPATIAFDLDNVSGDYDPDNAAGTYAGQVVPMVPTRWKVTHDGITYKRYSGFVQSWSVQAPGKTGDTFTTVRASDGFTVFQLLTVPDTYEIEVARDNPIAWWKLDEATGTVAADSGSLAVDGTYTNTPTLGQAGPMLNMPTVSFDDDNDEHVLIGALTGSDIAGDFTLEMYLSVDSGEASTGFQTLVQIDTEGGADEVMGAGINRGFANPIPYFQFLTGGAGPAEWAAVTAWDTEFVDDTFYHLVWVCDFASKTFTPYVNGVRYRDRIASQWDQTRSSGTMNVRIGGDVKNSTFSFDGLQTQVVIYDTKLSDARIAAHAASAYNGFPSELTSDRVTDILDFAEWPADARDISVGNSIMTELTVGQSGLLALLFEAQDTEDSELFIDGEGKVVFTNRNDRDVSAYAATFSNDGADTPYENLLWPRDVRLLRNVAQITDTDNVIHESKDTVSVAAYAPRTVTRTTQTTSATEPDEYADWLAAEFGTSLTRAQLTLLQGRTTSDANWVAMLGRQSGDLINVEVDPVSGGAQNEWDFFVEDITLTAKRDKTWEMVLGLSPAANQRMFTLDDDVLGELDGDNEGLLGW